MTALFRKVDCHSIPVADLDAALAFYCDGLGHELIWRDDSAAGLRLPDSDAELVLHKRSGLSRPTFWLLRSQLRSADLLKRAGRWL
jgi:catechol 2,3-dioxygenase-like lactoylglutathione lyase family enzyme